jgi:hypothetical protein
MITAAVPAEPKDCAHMKRSTIKLLVGTTRRLLPERCVLLQCSGSSSTKRPPNGWSRLSMDLATKTLRA